MVDASGNSAHAEAAAAAFGRRCIGVRITAAHDHAMRPQPVPFTAGGKRAVLPVWHLGRTPLFDQLGAAMERAEVKVAKAGDWRELALHPAQDRLPPSQAKAKRPCAMPAPQPPTGPDLVHLSPTVGPDNFQHLPPWLHVPGLQPQSWT